MQRSVVKDIELKHLLKQAITDQIHDRALFMKSVDVSCFYEGYFCFHLRMPRTHAVRPYIGWQPTSKSPSPDCVTSVTD